MTVKHTIAILVENHAGVLSRISGLFSRRGFNIESLAVGITDDPAVSRITIVVEGSDSVIEQVEKQLNKLIDVIRLRRLPSGSTTVRELMLIKVECNAQNRSDIVDIVRVMDAKVCDISKSTVTIEICDVTEQLEILEELLAPYHILEVARTGTVAMEKGAGNLQV